MTGLRAPRCHANVQPISKSSHGFDRRVVLGVCAHFRERRSPRLRMRPASLDLS